MVDNPRKCIPKVIPPLGIVELLAPEMKIAAMYETDISHVRLLQFKL
jgi:hypothetical protein